MPVKVKCSTCEKVLSVPDTARGKAIKCPGCQTRIAIPAETASPKAPAAKPKAKKPAKPADSEYALATFDMRRAEDTTARICPKCGFDMKYQDEEDTECPQCGYDAPAGGLGVKAKKKAMKGPDPADFYPGLFKEAWKFVGKNYILAWRTVIYTLVSLTVALGCAFLYFWISMWPPRAFLAFVGTLSFLVIPGWMWVLDVEIIKLTLERKDKFKKLNFDFFLASAMGAAFVIWCCAVAIPIVLIPTVLGYFFVSRMGGRSDIVLPICLALGAIPIAWMLPVAMSHMAMAVQSKGWMIWKIVPMWARNFKPLSLWFMWFILTNIPSIAGITTIAVVYGPDIVKIVEIMEVNADNTRKRFNEIENPNAKRKGDKAIVKVQIDEQKPVNFFPLIVPVVILYVMGVINGFTSMFNMRTNGQFSYYFKNSLDLVDRRKEYKYVAKERVDEDADLKPKSSLQLCVDALVFFLIFVLLGSVGGMLYGSFNTNVGMIKGILQGMYIGQSVAWTGLFFQSVKFAFSNSALWGVITFFGCYPIGFLVFVFQDFEERKEQFFQIVVGTLISVFVFILCLVGGVSLYLAEMPESNQPAPAQVERPAEPDAAAPKVEPAAPNDRPVLPDSEPGPQ